jgi:hypothetical protein
MFRLITILLIGMLCSESAVAHGNNWGYGRQRWHHHHHGQGYRPYFRGHNPARIGYYAPLPPRYFARPPFDYYGYPQRPMPRYDLRDRW